MNNNTGGEGSFNPGYESLQQLQSGKFDQKGITFNPALERDVLLDSNNSNWWHTLRNSITNITELRYQNKLQDIQDQMAPLAKDLYEGNYKDDKEKTDKSVELYRLRESLKPIQDEINDLNQSIANRPVNRQYELRALRDQLDSDTYSMAEFANDAGGSLSELSNQAIIGGASLLASKYRNQVLGKLATYLAEKAATSAVAAAPTGDTAAPIVFGAQLMYDAATLLGGAFASYRLRQRETATEVANNRAQKYENILSDMQKRKGGPLSDYEQNEAWLESKKGIDAVKDVNMDLWALDYAQTMMLFTPWGKLAKGLTSALGVGETAGKILSHVAVMPLEIVSEGNEEGIQQLVGDKYIRGDYKQYKHTGTFQSVPETWNLNSEATKAIFGLSDEQITKQLDYISAVRSGYIIGALFGAPSTVVGVSKDVVDAYKANKDINQLYLDRIDHMKLYDQVARIDGLYKNSRVESILDMADKVNPDRLKAKGIDDFSQEDIDQTKTVIKDVTSLLDKINNDPRYKEISQEEGFFGGKKKNLNKDQVRVQAINNILAAKYGIDKANKGIEDLNTQINNTYSTISAKETTEKASQTYADRVLEDKVKINRELESYKNRLTEESEYHKWASLDLTTKQKSDEKALLDKYANLSSEYESENYSKELSDIKTKYTESQSKLDKKLNEFKKSSLSVIDALSSRLAAFDLDNINISNKEIQNVNYTYHMVKALEAKRDDLQQRVDNDAKVASNTDIDAKTREETLSEIKNQLAAASDLYKFSIEDVLKRYNPENDPKIEKIIKGKLSDINDDIDNHSDNKTEDGTNLIRKSISHKLDLNRDISLFEKRLEKWKNPSELIKDASKVTEFFDASEPEVRTEQNTTQNVPKNKPTDNAKGIEVDDVIEYKDGSISRSAIVTGRDKENLYIQNIDADGNVIDSDKGEITIKAKDASIISRANDASNYAPESIDDIGTYEQPPITIYSENKPDIEINHPIKNIYDAISYSHSDSQDKIEVRDIDFSKYISNQTNNKDLQNATVIYELEADKSKLSRDKLEEYVDTLPIKIKLKIGDEIKDSGLYYHLPTYAIENRQIAPNKFKIITHLNISKDILDKGYDAVKQAALAELNRIKSSRRKIISSLLDPNNTLVYSDGIKVFTGHPNNISGLNGSITKEWNVKPSDLRIYVANSTGTRMDGTSEPYKGSSIPGTVLIRTTKTCNGEPALVKVNNNKLTIEHAEILFEAIKQKYTAPKGKSGFKSAFDNREKYKVEGLSTGEIIELLSLEGEAKTRYETNEHKWSDAQKSVMANKQLYVTFDEIDGKKKVFIHFGTAVEPLNPESSFGVEDTGLIETVKTKFIDWAIKNKNYPVHIGLQGLNGVKINEKVNRSFKLGQWEYNAKEGKTYGQILASNPVGEGRFAITTDVQEYVPGSIFKDPLLAIADKTDTSVTIKVKSANVKESVKKQSAIVKEKVNIKKTSTIRETSDEGYTDISAKDVSDLQNGTVIYEKVKIGRDPVENTTIYGYDPIGTIVNKDGINTIEFEDKPTEWRNADLAISNESIVKNNPETSEDFAEIEKADLDNQEAVVNEQEVENKEVVTTPVNIEDEFDSLISPEENDDPLLDINNANKKLTRLVKDKVISFRKAEVELNNIKKLIGSNFSTKIVDDYIYIASKGKHAFATFERDLITIANQVEIGTGYHEAFHRVSNLLISSDDRKAIYNQARLRYRTALENEFGKKQSYSNEEVDEVLAEEFRSFMLNKEFKELRILGKIKELFDKIWNWFNYYLLKRNPLNNVDIDSLYNNIATGKFRYSTPLKYEYETFGNTILPRVYNIKGIKTNVPGIDTAEQHSKVMSALVAATFKTNNIVNLSDINTLDFKPVLEYLVNRAKNAAALELKSNDPIEKTEYRRLINLYKSIYTNFNSVFLPLLKEQLVKLNVNLNDDLNMKSDEMSFDINDDNFIVNFDVNPLEVDQKTRVLPSIKFILATLPESSKPDSFTGLPTYGSFAQNWREILRELHYSTNYTTMMEKVEKMASNSEKWAYLKDRLINSPDEIKHQFHQVMRKHRHNFINLNLDILYDKKGNRKEISKYYIIDTLLQNEKNNLINRTNGGLWNAGFLESPIVSKKEGEPTKINVNELNNVIAEYKSLSSNLEEYLKNGLYNSLYDKITDLFNRLGVNIDKDTLDYVFYSDIDTSDINNKSEQVDKAPYESNIRNFVKNRIAYIFSEKGNLFKYATNPGDKAFRNIGLHNVLTTEKEFNKLAEAHVNAHLYSASDMVLGAAGKPYFAYSENNIVSDLVYAIKANNGELEDMLSCVNNKNSYILNRLLNSKHDISSFGVATFAAYDDENSGEDSVDYQGLSPMDDYMMKLLAVEHGLIPFPVLASKKMWYMYKGIPTVGLFDVIDGKAIISNQAVDIMYGYFLDEKNRIKQVQKDIDNAKNADGIIDYSQLRKFVHFNDPGKSVNGLRYLTFPSFNDANFSLEDEVQVKSKIKELLESRFNDEVEYAKELGIVSEEDGQLSSNKIPKELIESVAADNTGETAVKIILGNSLFNQMIGVIETEKIISGESMCYKPESKYGQPFDDQIKRLSVLASTGANLVESMKDPYDKDPNLTKTTYNTATLKPNKVNSAYYEDLISVYKGIYLSMGYDPSEVSKLAAKVLKGYHDSDNTDAQAFITPNMYRQIKMRLGEWSPEHEKSFNLIMSDEKLSLEDEITTRKFFMEPLKLVYFGHNRIKGGLDTVTYDKMSLATLFPRDMQGMEIKNLYDRMLNSEVDMVKFETATKAGVSTTSTYYTDEQITPNNFKLTPEPQQFKYLRRQLLTDPHEDITSKVGTQVLKVVIANIQKGGEYSIDGKPATGEQVINNFFGALKGISNNGVLKVLSDFGIDKNGDVIQDSILSDFLKEEAYKGNMPADIVNNLSTFNGRFNINLDCLTKTDWIVNRLISHITKKTIDIELPGKAMVQRSNIGFREVSLTDQQRETKVLEWNSSNRKEYSKYIDWVRNTEGVHDLKFYEVKKGELSPMECVVSISLFKNVIPNYNNITFDEAKTWLSNNPDIIGYRIPTQGQASIVMLRVSGFLPESSGDTIILPSEFTTLTGSDFDIDKLYTIRYNYKGNSKIKFKDKNPLSEEYKLESEANALIKEGKLTDEKRAEIIEKLNGLDYFRKKYDAKVKEYYKYYKHLLEKNDTLNKIRDHIENEYVNTDKKDYKIGLIKDQIIELNKAYSETTDPSKLNELQSKISSLESRLDNLRVMLDDREGFSEVVIDKYINKPEVLDMIANDLIKHGKFIDKFDFLLADSNFQNTEKAVQNRLIDTMFGILKNYNHIFHTTKPLDSINEVLKQKAGQFKLDRPLYDLERLTPRFQSIIKNQYNAGKLGVAFPALHNVHHSLSQTADLAYNTNLGVGVTKYEYIQDGVVKYTDSIGLSKLQKSLPNDTVFTPIGSSLSSERGVDGRFISDWLSAMINAFVDIEKDPYITSLNVNESTYDVTYMLLRIGSGEYTFDFIAQDILKDFANNNKLSKGVLSDIDNTNQASFITLDKYTSELDRLVKEHALDKSEFKSIKDTLFELNADNKAYVLQNLFNKPSDPKQLANWYYNQLEILATFVKLSQPAAMLSTLVRVSQIDTKKFGSNIIEMRQFTNNLSNFVKGAANTFVNVDKVLDLSKELLPLNGDGASHLGTLYNNSLNLLENVLSNKLIPFTQGYKNYYNAILDIIGKSENTSKRLINTIGKELHTQIISDFFAKSELNKDRLNELLKGKDSLPRRVYRIQNGTFTKDKELSERLKNNSIFKHLLRPEFPIDFPAYLKTAFKKDDDLDVDHMADSFRDLLYEQDPEVKKLAKDLILYSYVSSGFKQGVFSMHQFVGTDVRAELNYDGITFNDFVAEQLESLKNPEYYNDPVKTISTIRQVIKNLWYNNSIVPLIKDKYKVGDKFEDAIGFKNWAITKPIEELKDYKSEGKDIPVLYKIRGNDRLILGSNGTDINGKTRIVAKPYTKLNVSLSKVENGEKVWKNIRVLGEYIGYNIGEKNNIELVYKAVPKTSMSRYGFVLKENGLKYGISEELPESFFADDTKVSNWLSGNSAAFNTICPNFTSVPVENQIVIDKEVNMDITQRPEIESKSLMEEYINNLSDTDKQLLLSKYNTTNINDILAQEKDSLNSPQVIQVLEHLIKC